MVEAQQGRQGRQEKWSISTLRLEEGPVRDWSKCRLVTLSKRGKSTRWYFLGIHLVNEMYIKVYICENQWYQWCIDRICLPLTKKMIPKWTSIKQWWIIISFLLFSVAVERNGCDIWLLSCSWFYKNICCSTTLGVDETIILIRARGHINMLIPGSWMSSSTYGLWD